MIALTSTQFALAIQTIYGEPNKGRADKHTNSPLLRFYGNDYKEKKNMFKGS